MRHLLVISLLAACGGKAPAPTPPTTGSSITSVDAPHASGEPAAPPAPAATALDATVCAHRAEELGPVTLDAAQAGLRRGATAKQFGEVVTSKEQPIEVCGVAGQRGYLTRVTCGDGSSAFADPMSVGKARRGNVGPGGLCRSIIDVYAVTCPEAEYQVHVDMYMCGPGESFM
ncbi:MAG: hypothetical protein M3680_11520 [Myxococcota bacterium]|nr:hypothetical protein [Myxococcota bacterium]